MTGLAKIRSVGAPVWSMTGAFSLVYPKNVAVKLSAAGKEIVRDLMALYKREE